MGYGLCGQRKTHLAQRKSDVHLAIFDTSEFDPIA
jgi:hypothetical protein